MIYVVSQWVKVSEIPILMKKYAVFWNTEFVYRRFMERYNMSIDKSGRID